MTIKITTESAREAAYAVVMRQGANYRYIHPDEKPGECDNGCVNKDHKGNWSCLAARILGELGVPENEVNVNGGVDGILESLRRKGVIEKPDFTAAQYLITVQVAQDSVDLTNKSTDGGEWRNTWGYALAKGDEYLHNAGFLGEPGTAEELLALWLEFQTGTFPKVPLDNLISRTRTLLGKEAAPANE